MFSNKCINAFLIIYLLLISPSFSSQLLSHKATYILNVENIKNSLLEGGQGQTFFEIQEVCDGWNVREDYVLIYELPNNRGNARIRSRHGPVIVLSTVVWFCI